MVWKTRDVPAGSPTAVSATGPTGGPGGQIRAPFDVFAAVSKDGGTMFSQPMKMGSAQSPAPPTNRPFALSRDTGAAVALISDNILRRLA